MPCSQSRLISGSSIFTTYEHATDVVTGVQTGAPPCKRSLDMQAHKTWCLHGSVISLQFAPCLSSLSSDPGFGDRLLSRNLLRLPVKEPLLAGFEQSSLLACGQKGCSCTDTLPSMFARFHTGGPTADPTAVNIFSPLMWHVCRVVAPRCASAAELLQFKRTPGSTLLRLVGGENAHQERRQIMSSHLQMASPQMKTLPQPALTVQEWKELHLEAKRCLTLPDIRGDKLTTTC